MVVVGSMYSVELTRGILQGPAILIDDGVQVRKYSGVGGACLGTLRSLPWLCGYRGILHKSPKAPWQSSLRCHLLA